MLILAGMMGLMAAGGAVLLTSFDAETDEDREDQDAGAEGPPPGEPAPDQEEAVEPEENPLNRILWGDDADDSIDGGAGNDQINGYDGNDTLTGGNGADALFGADGQDMLRGGQGDDILHGQDGADTLAGGDGNDTLMGHFGQDHLQGGAGNDTLFGGQDDDLLDGGGDADALHGGYGQDLLVGGGGEDSLFGGAGDDILDGTDDTEGDFLNGGRGADTILAGAGDMVSGGADADLLYVKAAAVGEQPAEIMDFNPNEDRLAIVTDNATAADAEVTVEPDADTDGLTHILLDGMVAATLHTDEAIDHADIMLIPEDGLTGLHHTG